MGAKASGGGLGAAGCDAAAEGGLLGVSGESEAACELDAL